MEDTKAAKLLSITSYIADAEREKYEITLLLIQTQAASEQVEREQFAVYASHRTDELDKKIVALQEQYKAIELE